MTPNNIGPVASPDRIRVLDVLRGLAVGGILIGNMQWFSGYGMMPPALTAAWSAADQATHYLVHVLIEGKFYSIFSFLFGFGFALQIARAEERGDAGATLFKRRLAWLLVIGLLHAYLLWAGDILSIYALMGFVLLLFRRKSDTSLLKWAIAMMIVPIITATILLILFAAFAPADVMTSIAAGQTEFWNDAVRKASQGTYFEILTDFNLQYIVGRYAGLIFQMRLPKILAMFLLGYYAYRRGFFHEPEKHREFIKKVAIFGLGFGLPANLLFAWLAGNEAPFPPSVAGLGGVIAYAFGVPALALGITALVARLWHRSTWQRILDVLAPVGRMALTNYLMQSVICVFLFYGYGFGKFGSFTAVQATLTAIAIFAFQVILSTAWLSVFAYGPMEWIWRQLTYKRRLPLRRRS